MATFGNIVHASMIIAFAECLGGVGNACVRASRSIFAMHKSAQEQVVGELRATGRFFPPHDRIIVVPQELPEHTPREVIHAQQRMLELQRLLGGNLEEFGFVEDLAATMIHCRQVLKWMYAYGYFAQCDGQRRKMLKCFQVNFEGKYLKLGEILRRSLTREELTKEDHEIDDRPRGGELIRFTSYPYLGEAANMAHVTERFFSQVLIKNRDLGF